MSSPREDLQRRSFWIADYTWAAIVCFYPACVLFCATPGGTLICESGAFRALLRRAMSKSKLAYVELPARGTKEMKDFYGGLFGWSFQDWGDDYTSFSESGVDGGFNAGEDHRTKAPLVMIETSDIEAMEKRVQQAGGKITQPTFRYPGGSRFHFTDPSGNELAVMQVD